MKKVFTLLFITVAFAHFAFGQTVSGIPAKDAETFLNSLNADVTNPAAVQSAQTAIVKILNFYAGRNDITPNNLDAEMRRMAFLKDYAAQAQAARIAVAGNANIQLATPTGGGVPGLGGMDVTNIADGIAKFLIKRGKQELSMAFFERFSDTLKKYPEIRYIFPKTSQIVQNVDLNNYSAFLQELKDAFSKDLLKIPADILSLRDITSSDCGGDAACQTSVAAINNFFNHANAADPDPRVIVFPLIAVQGALDGNTIIEIADQLATDKSVCSVNDDLNSAIKFSAILLASIKNSESDGGLFLDATKLKALFYSKDQLKVLFGLLSLQYKRNDCYKDLQINGKSLDGIFQKVLDVQLKFYSGISYINQINFAYKAIQKQVQAGQKIDAASAVSLTAASLNSITTLVPALYTTVGATPPANFDLFIKNIKSGIDLCTDIQQKNYSGIFTGTIKLLNDNKLINADAKGNTVKYLAFAANLASASNSDEVSDAIETVALPPGSYSIKQKAALNVSLNGYIGYAWDFNKVAKDLYAQGVYAPVGFTVSRTLNKKHGGAISLFASLIDVGSVASYRLKSSATDTLKQQVRLESIISPSAQLVVGLPKLPVSFSAGWRMTPKMFYSGEKVFKPVEARSVFNLAVLIDIPIFTLYNKSIY